MFQRSPPGVIKTMSDFDHSGKPGDGDTPSQALNSQFCDCVRATSHMRFVLFQNPHWRQHSGNSVTRHLHIA